MNKIEYLLVCLNEECSEIIKLTDKALRFGLNDSPPSADNPGTNLENIMHELNDLMGVCKMMVDEGIFKAEEIMNEGKVAQKVEKIKKFMKYSAEKGILEIKRPKSVTKNVSQ